MGDLPRSYTLFDLICVGVGGTVGSGVFVLTGLIARENGPATPLCFFIGGIACTFSAASYAELSAKIPSTGSGYAYVRATLGEFPSFMAAALLTLEYGVAASAVAVSWGDKLSLLINTSQPQHVNIAAGLLQFLCVLVLLAGLDVSKRVVNVFTVAKLVLVILMTAGGLCLLKPANLSSPPAGEVGAVTMGGVLSGASISFFAFLGYDEVCFLSSESVDGPRSMAPAVFGTLLISTVAYVFASLALVGMQQPSLISAESGFTEAFLSHGGSWVGFAQLVAMGELLTLPLVTLITFMAQPRLLLALANDGLLPAFFAKLDARKNMTNGIVVAGVASIAIALTMPFITLESAISSGVLLSLQGTNLALLLMRKQGLSSAAALPEPGHGSGAAGSGGDIHGLTLDFNPLAQSSSHSSHTDPTDLQGSDEGRPEAEAEVEAEEGQEAAGKQYEAHCTPPLIPPPALSTELSRPLLIFHAAAIGLSLGITQLGNEKTEAGALATAVLTLFVLVCAAMAVWTSVLVSRLPDAPPPHHHHNHHRLGLSDGLFEVPLVPFVPLLGTVINYLLLAQLTIDTAIFVAGYLGVSAGVYFLIKRRRQLCLMTSCKEGGGQHSGQERRLAMADLDLA
jgi:APA family basic amino acid/polyamine antiporter